MVPLFLRKLIFSASITYAFSLSFCIVLASSQAIARPVLTGKEGDYHISEFIDSSTQKTWSALIDFKNQAKWATDIVQTDVFEVNSRTIELRQIHKAKHTFGLKVKVHLIVKKDPPARFSYKLVQSNHLNTLEGNWRITQLRNGVQLSHKVMISPKIPAPLLPLYYQLQEQNLKDWMTILKRQIEAK